MAAAVTAGNVRIARHRPGELPAYIALWRRGVAASAAIPTAASTVLGGIIIRPPLVDFRGSLCLFLLNPSLFRSKAVALRLHRLLVCGQLIQHALGLAFQRT